MKRTLPAVIAFLSLTACTGEAVPTASAGPATAVTTSSTPPPVTGTLAVETTVAPLPAPDLTEPQVVYFFRRGSTGQQPALTPVWFDETSPQGLAGAIELLLAGPSDRIAFSTEIPLGTELRDVTVTDGVALIDLSTEFEEGAGSASVLGRLAQLVFTATRFEEVLGIAIRLEGEPVRVFSAEGVIVDPPVTRDSFIQEQPPLFVDQPAYGGPLGQPGVVAGSTTVEAAAFTVEVRDADGVIIASQPLAPGPSEAGTRPFRLDIRYTVDVDQEGELTVRAVTTDGAELVHTIPVTLALPDIDAACSASGLAASTLPQDLPVPVTETRDAIVAAAVNCDYAALAAIAARGPEFIFSFGEIALTGELESGAGGDPAAFWQGEEQLGIPVLRQMVQLLNTEPALSTELPEPTYLWPAAFAAFPLLPGDLEPLRGILTAEELAAYAEFGEYLGLRLGISDDGIWRFAVAGD